MKRIGCISTGTGHDLNGWPSPPGQAIGTGQPAVEVFCHGVDLGPALAQTDYDPGCRHEKDQILNRTQTAQPA